MKFLYEPLDVYSAKVTIDDNEYEFKANAEGVVSALVRTLRRNLDYACLDIVNDTTKIYYEDNKLLIEEEGTVKEIDITLREFTKIIHDAYYNADIPYVSDMKEIPIKKGDPKSKIKTISISVGNFYSKEMFFIQLDDLKEFID